MKKRLYKEVVFLFPLLIATIVAHTQSKEPAENQRIIEAKNYVFKAQRASPLKGRDVHLTTEYDLTVVGDSVIAALPYYGRAYSAPMNTSDGGITFTSSKSEYTLKTKKGKWLISIRPADVRNVEELYLEIFDNGRASLRLTLQDRQPISYDGYIVERKK